MARMMVLLVPLATSLLAPTIAPIELRTEALSNPIGIAESAPKLSWKLREVGRGGRNLVQSAYHVQVGASPGTNDLWDSGETTSEESVGIRYAGRRLSSGQKAYWRVKVADGKGAFSSWSPVATFSVGLLEPKDWRADWIGYDAPFDASKPESPFEGAEWIWNEEGSKNAFLRYEFDLATLPSSATMWVSADDQWDVKINGVSIGKSQGTVDSWRTPKQYDAKSAIKLGKNLIEFAAVDTGGDFGALASLTLTDSDGRKTRYLTDQRWQGSTTPNGPWVRAVKKANFGATPWGRVGPNTTHLPPPRLVRNEFEVGGRIERATAYVAALGLLELRLNGRRVGDEYFTPGWTDYEKRVHSRAYDVTKLLRQGANAVGAVLGDGWYAGYVGYGGVRNHYGTKIRALVQIEIEMEDGTKQIVTSGKDWHASTGPIVFSDFLMGEAYDASKEATGWDRPVFNREGWKPVDVGAEVSPVVEPFPGQPVVAFETLRAKSVAEPVPGTYVLDLGQNIAGFARVRMNGKRGQKIVLRFAERLNPDGTIYVTNLRGAKATDTYLCAQDGWIDWEPKFTFHGFQYIEVTGVDRAPRSGEIVGVAVSSDCPDAGTIETGSPMINRLVQNAWWTQKMNFIDVPTDCPQRDERLGWTGDAQAYIHTATMLNDVEPFFRKWLVALDDAQRADGQYPMVAPLKVAGGDGGPAWADAGVICPWTIYEAYGDKDLLARHYPQMKKFIEFTVKRSKPGFLPPDQFHCFGDWVAINENTPPQVIYMAYFAYSAQLVSKAAAVLGKDDEAKKYDDLFKQVRASFQKNYVASDGIVAGDTQCAYVLAIAFDLLEPDQLQKASHHFVERIKGKNWHLATGFVGTRDIMNALSKIDRNDVALRLLHNDTFPSWGFTIKNGATSIWERWDGWTPEKGFQDPGMNSFAHYAFGAVVGWIFDQPAGIKRLEAGYRKVSIAPQLDPKMGWLKSKYRSVRGDIVSEWSVVGGKFTMRVVVPPNMKASIYVPMVGAKAWPPDLKGQAVHGSTWYEVGSGEYRFEAPLPSSP